MGAVDGVCNNSDWPKTVYYIGQVKGELMLFKAYITNAAQGVYHGFPIEPSEVPNKIKRIFNHE